jgi:hypothetical protein
MMKQTREHSTIFVFLATLALAAAMTGCGGKATVKTSDGRKYDLQESRFETLWVEPQIVASDSLMTLIRSERIDSIEIDPVDRAGRPRKSIEFRIAEPRCQVSIGLYNSDLRMVYPLMVRDLPTGFYRLTVNMEIFREPPPTYQTFFLKADYCGRTEVALVAPD